MGLKNIAIIGGGISGLAVLHFLNKASAGKVSVTLYERGQDLGGTVQTLTEGGFYFETGPNGFLENAATLELIKDLGLDDQLIEALPQNRRRYIQINGRLYPVPLGVFSFFQTPLLSLKEKSQVLKGFFGKQQLNSDRSIYEYTSVRFGQGAAEKLFDPFVSGIFAGDIKRLHMASVFPKREGKRSTRLYSLKQGMGQLIRALHERYASQINTGRPVGSLAELNADHAVCSIPAYAARLLLKEKSAGLADSVSRVPYAPIAVVGLAFERSAFRQKPDGFGYLIPSDQRKEILGVLLESNCFEGRAPEGKLMLRVMLGGAHHPEIVNDAPEALLETAVKELDQIYGLKEKPIRHWVKSWPLAIPQYEMDYPNIVTAIRKEAAQIPQLTLAGSYLNGISFNDCANSAKSIAQSLAV